MRLLPRYLGSAGNRQDTMCKGCCQEGVRIAEGKDDLRECLDRQKTNRYLQSHPLRDDQEQADLVQQRPILIR
jgi:hypothetical protein